MTCSKCGRDECEGPVTICDSELDTMLHHARLRGARDALLGVVVIIVIFLAGWTAAGIVACDAVLGRHAAQCIANLAM